MINRYNNFSKRIIKERKLKKNAIGIKAKFHLKGFNTIKSQQPIKVGFFYNDNKQKKSKYISLCLDYTPRLTAQKESKM